jgi:hypothetical protein
MSAFTAPRVAAASHNALIGGNFELGSGEWSFATVNMEPVAAFPVCPSIVNPVSSPTVSSSTTWNLFPCYKELSGVYMGVNEDGAMPINRLLKNSKLGVEEIEKLSCAYSYALRSLSLVDRNDPLSEMLARKIIEIGATGISDPVEISNIVVRKFGNP